MDKVHYLSNPMTSQEGKFPVTIEGLEFIQSQIMQVQNLAFCGGDNYVIKEPQANPVKCGLIVWNGEILPLSGVSANYIQIETTKVSVNTSQGIYTDVREIRIAKYITKSSGTAETETLKKRSSFKDLETNEALSQRLTWVYDLLGFRLDDMQSAIDELTDAFNSFKSATNIRLATITITNFDTFNPSTDATASKLAVGESCSFYSYNATSRPAMNNSGTTVTSSSDPIYSIYGWSGTITRLYSTYYMITAYGTNTTTGRPQVATRVYYGSSRYDWVVQSEYLNASESGYVKFPSGLMLQWGVATPSPTGGGITTVYFPISFTATYSIAVMPVTNQTANAHIVQLRSKTVSTFETKGIYESGNTAASSTVPYNWFAIGRWK